MKNDDEELTAVRSAVQESPYLPQMSWLISDQEDLPKYVAIDGSYRVVPKERLRSAGWKVTKKTLPVVQKVPDTWLDTHTGEIVTKTQARKHKIRLPELRSVSDKFIDTHIRIGDCPPKERPFVAYLLAMRNRRGGLTAGLDAVIDRWIAFAYPGLLSNHKARKRKELKGIIEKRRLMVNDLTMARDLQILNPAITKQDILEEAARVFSVLPVRGKTHSAIGISATITNGGD
ncbi:hypothetical protein AWB75_00159 [Caballeronia catudaia]|uniref:Uncharacterized protein n=1 Tax=Caballeronia catudaia TaxID=1777136 RepID=A0A157Z3L2_9BURK|nr:hypothetical protein [Caballeronia catudaia]SAK40114.1 hypothetical protein AWB75_00159 [Caballeronia catudaia]